MKLITLLFYIALIAIWRHQWRAQKRYWEQERMRMEYRHQEEQKAFLEYRREWEEMRERIEAAREE